MAGSAFQVTVTARDQAGAVVTNYGGTINLTTSDGNATLPPTATFTAGVATFTATLRTAGPQTITATDAAVASITAQGAVTVSPAAAARLDFEQQPTGTLVGAPFLPALRVVARDAFDNVATNNNSDCRPHSIAQQSHRSGTHRCPTDRLVNGVAAFPTLGVSKAGTGFTLSASSRIDPGHGVREPLACQLSPASR